MLRVILNVQYPQGGRSDSLRVSGALGLADELAYEEYVNPLDEGFQLSDADVWNMGFGEIGDRMFHLHMAYEASPAHWGVDVKKAPDVPDFTAMAPTSYERELWLETADGERLYPVWVVGGGGWGAAYLKEAFRWPRQACYIYDCFFMSDSETEFVPERWGVRAPLPPTGEKRLPFTVEGIPVPGAGPPQ